MKLSQRQLNLMRQLQGFGGCRISSLDGRTLRSLFQAGLVQHINNPGKKAIYCILTEEGALSLQKEIHGNQKK